MVLSVVHAFSRLFRAVCGWPSRFQSTSTVAAQTGSSFPEWFPVLPTCFPDRCPPPEACPIVRNIRHRFGKLLPVCCRHAGFSRKSSSRTSTSPNFSRNPSRTPATTSKPIVLSKILQVCSWSKNGRKRLLQPHPTYHHAISSLFVDRF